MGLYCPEGVVRGAYVRHRLSTPEFDARQPDHLLALSPMFDAIDFCRRNHVGRDSRRPIDAASAAPQGPGRPGLGLDPAWASARLPLDRQRMDGQATDGAD